MATKRAPRNIPGQLTTLPASELTASERAACARRAKGLPTSAELYSLLLEIDAQLERTEHHVYAGLRRKIRAMVKRGQQP